MFKRLLHFLFARRRPLERNSAMVVGENTIVPENTDIAGDKNIHIGSNVYIGPRCVFYSTRANLVIGNHVMLGPEVMIITGDHRIDIPYLRLDEVTEEMKLPENDRDVIIEDDVWIGARALILKGVTIHTGAVIAAGATVLEDVPPNTVYYAKGKTKPRF